MRTRPRDRIGAGLCAALAVGSLGYVLLFGLRAPPRLLAAEPPLVVLDVRAPPPPPPKPKPPPRPAHRADAGKAAPPNLRNKPTPIVIVRPVVPLPVPPLIVAAPITGVGQAASAGASDRPGPGTGAGGEGNGTGSGGYGDGEGDGGEPPRLIRGRLRFGDMPQALRNAGVQGTVSVRYVVEVDGRVGACLVIGSSGNAVLDAVTCRLIAERFRFRPSRDADGRPVRSEIEEDHSWIVDRPSERPGD